MASEPNSHALFTIAHYCSLYNQFVLLSVYSYEFFVSELIVWLCFFSSDIFIPVSPTRILVFLLVQLTHQLFSGVCELSPYPPCCSTYYIYIAGLPVVLWLLACWCWGGAGVGVGGGGGGKGANVAQL